MILQLIEAAPWDDQSIYLQVTRGADNKRDHAFPPASVAPGIFAFASPLVTTSATRCAHTLKGNAGNIGAHELEHAAAALEAACSKRETATIDQLLPKLGQTLATVLGGLAALAPAPATASSSTAVDVQSLLPQFTRLAEQLVDGDAEAVETSHELCAALAGTVHEAAMQKIDQAIDRFDFDAAHELLSGFTPALTVTH